MHRSPCIVATLAAALLALASGCNAISYDLYHVVREVRACTGHDPWCYFHSSCTGQIVRKPVTHECHPGLPQPAFFGYEATCWRKWPYGWVGCPIQEEEIIILDSAGEPIVGPPVRSPSSAHILPATPSTGPLPDASIQVPRPAGEHPADLPQSAPPSLPGNIVPAPAPSSAPPASGSARNRPRSRTAHFPIAIAAPKIGRRRVEPGKSLDLVDRTINATPNLLSMFELPEPAPRSRSASRGVVRNQQVNKLASLLDFIRPVEGEGRQHTSPVNRRRTGRQRSNSFGETASQRVQDTPSQTALPRTAQTGTAQTAAKKTELSQRARESDEVENTDRQSAIASAAIPAKPEIRVSELVDGARKTNDTKETRKAAVQPAQFVRLATQDAGESSTASRYAPIVRLVK